MVLYALTRGNTALSWKQGFLAGIAMAMATLPEEFPVVLTIFLALGAWRISQKRVLTRRIPAIETLGAATVLCVDKTGTLTQNRMSVRKLFADGQIFDANDPQDTSLPEDFHRLVEFGILASKKDPFDPMEKALRELGTRHLARTEHLHDNWTLVHEYPLSPELLALSHVWQSPDGRQAHDRRQGRARGHRRPVPPRRGSSVRSSGRPGRRRWPAKGCASWAWPRAVPWRQATCRGTSTTSSSSSSAWSAWPTRSGPAVPRAIQECYAAGIRVVMITGDYPATAQSIARQIGLRIRRRDHHRPGAGSDGRRGAPATRIGTAEHLRPRRARSRSCGSSTPSRPTARSWP